MHIVCFKHVPFEGPAASADWAQSRGHSIECIEVYAEDPLPDANRYEMLIVMCGPMNIYQEGLYPWLAVEKQAIRKAIDEADLEYLREEIPGALDQGKAGSGKIREIVLALKDFSHPGSGTPEPSDINRLVESTVTVARNEYKYVADVTLELDPDLGPVSCMPSALGQVVLNIVVNAAHAIAEQSDRDGRGKITVRTQSLDEDQVEISISDNGPGVPEKIQSKIFDPFFTTKEVGRGTGQGLAISRRVVTEQHAGRLLLESEPGEGATFRIVLPLKSSHSSDALGAVA